LIFTSDNCGTLKEMSAALDEHIRTGAAVPWK
jgi:hypothetical protein